MDRDKHFVAPKTEWEFIEGLASVFGIGPIYWKLDAEHRPVPCRNAHEWDEWVSNLESRTVARTDVHGFEVSTIFLSVGPIPCFETMVFAEGREFDGFTVHTASWDEARACHEATCDTVHRYLTDESGEMAEMRALYGPKGDQPGDGR